MIRVLSSSNTSVIAVFLSRFLLDLGRVAAQAGDIGQGAQGTRSVLTTEWTEEIFDVPSQWTLDDEYNGRGFDKETDSFELTKRYGA